MIEVYTWPTPNGHKIHIMLEETGLEHQIRPVNIRTGEQFRSDFLRISPNNKIPAIVDRDGPDGKPISVFESGAILLYLARKSGKLMPHHLAGEAQVLRWSIAALSSVEVPVLAMWFEGPGAPEGGFFSIMPCPVAGLFGCAVGA